MDAILLIFGFISTFFVPGFVIIQTFFPGFRTIEKFSLYGVVSVLVSTWVVYLVSLVFGYSRETILLVFIAFGLLFLLVIARQQVRLTIPKKHIPGVLVSIVIAFLLFVALYPAIFGFYNGYFVMSADNWQDTAMHLGIIESISQGNFPPQPPYFSGVPMAYYYFADLHTAILATLKDSYFPRILVFDNPVLFWLFALSIYALAYEVKNSVRASIFATVIACFSSNALFLRFFRDLFFQYKPGENVLIQVRDLMATATYSLDYGNLMQITPMVDYFLQNRPMMVGLPAVVLMGLLVWRGFNQLNTREVVLAGIITALLVKFQLFAFGVACMTALVAFILFWRKSSNRVMVKLIFLFFIPVVLTAILLLGEHVGARSTISVALATLKTGPWDNTRTVWWYLLFYIGNFGILFVVWVGALAYVFWKRIFRQALGFFVIWTAILFIIPHAVKFTIYQGDMLKFFYFMTIPASVLVGLALENGLRRHFISSITVVAVFLIVSLTSFLTLGASFFNKYFAYSQADYSAGMWIREKTPQKSVFLTTPTVHSAVSEIGGRLRVLSYTMWPYSHGYNVGPDSVSTRQQDVETAFGKNDQMVTKQILKRYGVSYVFYGSEERSSYPLAGKFFDSTGFLQKVYDYEGIIIYKVSI